MYIICIQQTTLLQWDDFPNTEGQLSWEHGSLPNYVSRDLKQQASAGQTSQCGPKLSKTLISESKSGC